MKRDADYFEGKDAILVYVAKKLRDALRLERVLTEAGVDYGVETDEYSGGMVFKSVRTGAFFYVLPESVASVHEVMQNNGFRPHAE